MDTHKGLLGHIQYLPNISESLKHPYLSWKKRDLQLSLICDQYTLITLLIIGQKNLGERNFFFFSLSKQKIQIEIDKS